MPKVQPITPAEVSKVITATIPDEVVTVFNKLITRNWNGHSSCVTQNEAVELVAQQMGVSRQKALDNHWLDVESLFEAAGWKVVYDKPGYNEPYPATFTFSRR